MKLNRFPFRSLTFPMLRRLLSDPLVLHLEPEYLVLHGELLQLDDYRTGDPLGCRVERYYVAPVIPIQRIPCWACEF